MAQSNPRATWLPLSVAALLATACGAPPEQPPASPSAPAAKPAASAEAPAAQTASLAPPTLRLPATVRPSRYDLDLAIDPSKETFTGSVGVDLTLKEATSVLWLNATGLTIKEARVVAAGQPLTARVVPGGEDFVGFSLDRPVGPGTARLTVAYEGPLDKERSHGIYRQSEGPGEDDAYAYTFFEPVDARRAFPCFDEPGYKVPWKITLRVKKGHVALANAPVEKEAPGPDGTKVVTFEETRPLPSYLVALIVGPFDIIDAGKAGHHNTPLRFAVPRGRGAETRYAAEVTPRIVGLLEDYFGMPYPYGKLDVAVVPRFWGTMEHPGLVALGQPLTLIKPGEETPQRKRSYANVAIHELAHYWFGDYVTMAWWDDTWLNEAMATWLDSKITHALEPGWGVEVARVAERSWAMSTDALATAKKIRQPVESKDDIANAFDNSITYMKGASVLGMFEGFVGPDRFQKGIQRYMREHAWGNATADDLLSALSAEAGRDLAPALKTFLDQAGLPLVSAEPVCDKGAPPRLKLTQERFVPAGSAAAGAAAWQVPVCVKYGAKKGEGRACTLLAGPSAEIPLEAEKGCPTWVMPNEGAQGYYRASYSPATLGALFGKEAPRLTPRERVSLVTDTSALVQAGKLPLGDALGLLPGMVKGADRHVLSSSMGILHEVRDDLLSPELRAKLAKLVRNLYGERARALGLSPKPGEPDDARLLRPRLAEIVGFLGEDPALLKEAHALALKWLGDRKAIAPDLVQTVLALAARSDDAELFRRLREAAKATADRRERAQILGALGAFRAPALNREALGLLLGGEFDLRDAGGLLGPSLRSPETRDATYDFLKKNFDALTARMRSDEAMWLYSIPSVYCDEAHRADAAAFFGERAKKAEGAPRQLANALEEVSLCAAQHARNKKSIEDFLKKL